ncbi:Na/Pi cotransporter family protein [Shimia sediminis]|uniref:Na/Pi cotransporter family protein n=1 Tax=Shimia sediminis TaxID=2497945 RepID=UPI001F23B2ED|nr:Na/Pi symporter [Shimia sediminis]
MIRKLIVPIALSLLVLGFWAEPDLQEIAAGVAIFLFGMMMLEDGFKLFSGGLLEKILAKATASIPRALGFGMLTTTLMQSSSLVTLVTISFLSAGLITLTAGVAIIFGANIGTTTGAWLVAGFGLKVDIAAYAMPMLAFAVVLVFQSSKYMRGVGLVLAGMGFLFLGIHYMKEGFEGFQEQFDLNRFALPGLLGLIIYTLIGAVMTVVMQSSHATMVIIITALATGQISYENALALAIGSNIGTTVTAMIGALTANYQGRRLALAHLIFNLATAVVALVLIVPLVQAVDTLSAAVGIAQEDYALKLAVFHTIFNLLGVGMMLPVLSRLIRFLEHRIAAPRSDTASPIYLTDATDDFPEVAEEAMRKELGHLMQNAETLIAKGLNLDLAALKTAPDIAAVVEASQSPVGLDYDLAYDQQIKPLHAAIVEFASRVGLGDKGAPEAILQRIHDMRDGAGRVVRAVKAVKHLRGNATRYTARDQGATTVLYNAIRAEIARMLVEMDKVRNEEPDRRSALWLDEERVQAKRAYKDTIHVTEALIRDGSLSAAEATSLINDSQYGYEAIKDMIEACKRLHTETETGVDEVERILSLDEDETEEMAMATRRGDD